MKKYEFPQPKKVDTPPSRLYPERASVGIEEKIQGLADLEQAHSERYLLSEQDRELLRDFENTLGETLEKIFLITPREATFYAEYFLSSEGRSDLEKISGGTVPEDMATPQDAEKFLYLQTESIAAMNANERGALVGRSRDYSEKQLLQELLLSAGDHGELKTQNVQIPSRVTLLLSPEKNQDRASSLRKFKDHLKKYRETLGTAVSTKSPDFQAVLVGVLDLYQSRTNLMLAESSIDPFIIEKKRLCAGEESLSETEREILRNGFGLDDGPKNLARYDKFIHGASGHRDGWRDQIGEELGHFTDKIETAYLESVLQRREAILEKGLAPEKISDTNDLQTESIVQLAEETLSAYGLLSELPASQYDPDREGPAPDGKWQFMASGEFKTMAVDGKRKVIKCGVGSQSVATALSITIAHEIEGHVLQHENRSRIPLRLFQKLGSGRTSVFAECGAMYNQDLVSKNAFGYGSPPHPHYLRAMQRKLEGGNYLDCVQAFYASAMKAPALKKTLGQLDDAGFQKEIQTNLKLAINRSRRLFSAGEDLSTSSPFLTNSKDTVYLEQVKLFQELSKHDAEKYAFILGANIDTLIFLIKSGFLNPRDIQKPMYHSLRLWERMKDDYLLTEAEPEK